MHVLPRLRYFDTCDLEAMVGQKYTHSYHRSGTPTRGGGGGRASLQQQPYRAGSRMKKLPDLPMEARASSSRSRAGSTAGGGGGGGGSSNSSVVSSAASSSRGGRAGVLTYAERRGEFEFERRLRSALGQRQKLLHSSPASPLPMHPIVDVSTTGSPPLAMAAVSRSGGGTRRNQDSRSKNRSSDDDEATECNNEEGDDDDNDIEMRSVQDSIEQLNSSMLSGRRHRGRSDKDAAPQTTSVSASGGRYGRRSSGRADERDEDEEREDGEEKVHHQKQAQHERRRVRSHSADGAGDFASGGEDDAEAILHASNEYFAQKQHRFADNGSGNMSGNESDSRGYAALTAANRGRRRVGDAPSLIQHWAGHHSTRALSHISASASKSRSVGGGGLNNSNAGNSFLGSATSATSAASAIPHIDNDFMRHELLSPTAAARMRQQYYGVASRSQRFPQHPPVKGLQYFMCYR